MNRRSFISAGLATAALPFLPSIDRLGLDLDYLAIAPEVLPLSEIGKYKVVEILESKKVGSRAYRVYNRVARMEDLKKGDHFFIIDPKDGYEKDNDG